MSPRGALAGALGAYFLLGVLLIAQKPGLQYDEALLVSGGLPVSDPVAAVGVCRFGYCFSPMAPLGLSYIGAVKQYLCLPLFALFGPQVALIRLVSMALGAIGIWGLWKLVAGQAGAPAAAAVAMILAIHPAYVNMTVFDNGAVGGMMAAFGLLCAAAAAYLDGATPRAAFWMGAAAGFGVWTRANFLWLTACAALAALVVLRRRALLPVPHLAAIAGGGLLGGLPFLVYQIGSGGGTLRALEALASAQPLGDRIQARFDMLSYVLLADSEHLDMWGQAPKVGWQTWGPVLTVAAAVVLCLLVPAQRLFPRFAAATFLSVGVFLFLSSLDIAEHHLIALVPLAAVAVVLACAVLHRRFRWTWPLPAGLAAVFVGTAFYWHAATLRGLRSTAGVNMWSDGVYDLARLLQREYLDRDIQVLDWGFRQNLYVLSGGRLRLRESFWEERSWSEDFRAGDVFVSGGPENRAGPSASARFLQALAEAKPVFTRRLVPQRGGTTYAQVFEIQRGSMRGPVTGQGRRSSLSMADPESAAYLDGFYPIEDGTYRWTRSRFSITLEPGAPDGRPWLAVKVYVPEASIRALGQMTLRARLGVQELPPETWRKEGLYWYQRPLPDSALIGGARRIDFALDRWLPPSASDARELGIVVLEASIRPR
jgi:hypothetical protein